MKFDTNMQTIEGVILNVLHGKTEKPPQAILEETERILRITIKHQKENVDTKRWFSKCRRPSRATRRFGRLLKMLLILKET